LDSFTERRFAKLSLEPYNGESLDSSRNGSIPNAWDVDVRPNRMFEQCTKNSIIPHSEVSMVYFLTIKIYFLFSSIFRPVIVAKA
jgi:hypothetical protein